MGIILGAYRDEQSNHLEDISIQNYIFQYMYHIKTQIHIFFARSRGVHRKHGNDGLSSLIPVFIWAHEQISVGIIYEETKINII